MSELKRTQLYDVHVSAGATMVDFGGWEMPIQYPSGIIAEHLYTRQVCGLFDVSHMGRLLIEGPQRKEFLQHVLTSNVSALDLNMAQYCIIPNENGGAVDDAYLYLFQEDSYLLVVNAANIDKDLEHLNRALIVEHEAVPQLDIVNVVPQPKAGSSFATAAYHTFRHPVAVEEIRADAGLDVGGTLIGMHLKKVAVPVRLEQDHIGGAIVLAARVRPKFIGGDRAVYDETLKEGYPDFTD